METATILILDDDKTFTGLLKTVFELEGYQAAVTTRLADLMPVVRQVKPALLVMDVHVGQEDTLGALRELKSDEITKTIPVIMASGMDRSNECLNTGADAFILKPFRPAELLEIAERFIGEQDTIK
ncbi:MAG: response regulator transcription factor [Anaerolineae bacterium]|nr:response regulator transcription factor [Anaerolineae bacterium]